MKEINGKSIRLILLAKYSSDTTKFNTSSYEEMVFSNFLTISVPAKLATSKYLGSKTSFISIFCQASPSEVCESSTS
jgi:hypothetical protein